MDYSFKKSYYNWIKLFGGHSLLSNDMQALVAQKIVKVEEEQGVMRAGSKGTHFSLTLSLLNLLFSAANDIFPPRTLIFPFLQ